MSEPTLPGTGAPEVESKLREVRAAAARCGDFAFRDGIWEKSLRAALVELAQTRQQMHDMEADLAKELNGRAREVQGLRDQGFAARAEATRLREERDEAVVHDTLWRGVFECATDEINTLVLEGDSGQERAAERAAVIRIFRTLGILLASVGIGQEAVEKLNGTFAQSEPQAAFVKAVLDAMDAAANRARAMAGGTR